jgi:mRNA interferase MazF
LPLGIHPEVGTVVVCDYTTGFKPPEMVKLRLAVVISPRLKRRNNLCTVVPLSTQDPDPAEEFHRIVTLPQEVPKYPGLEKWAKCDMLATVGFQRLALPQEERQPFEAVRRYINMRLGDEDIVAVLNCVRRALGMAIVD